jgi:TrmH family RNA methyltransferase
LRPGYGETVPPGDAPPSISSSANPRIKELVRLRTRRERDRSGLFLIEGYRELSRALAGGVSLAALYCCPALYLGGNEDALVEQARQTGAEVLTVAEAPFHKASYRDRPEGLLAVARQFPTDLERLHPGTDPLFLAVEGIEKPGNLGTMLRTAEASLGTLFSIPLAVADTQTALAWLRRCGVRTVATTPSATLAHWEADLTGPVAVAVGSEQYGLSDSWIEAADQRVLIPMPGSVDSLNAAMAAGIVLFEAVRQRRSRPA